MDKLKPYELITLLKFYSSLGLSNENADRIFEIAKALKASQKEPK